MLNLGDAFKKYFEVVPAMTSELKDHVFRIRHNVYCEELKFEPVRPDGRETDAYDEHSLHCLLRSVNTGEFVGCTRLIRTRPEDPYYPLPFERTCSETLDRSIIDPQNLPRHKIGEVSRLAVLSTYRRRKGEQGSVTGLSDESFGDAARPRFPYIPVGLYLGIIELSLQHGIDTIFVLTEPRLASQFARLGVKVERIGGAVTHRGERIPSMMNCRSIVDGLNFLTRPLYKVIASEVEHHLLRTPGPKPKESS
jgi:N-acyl amino acid synthase of PEP-CTERM/exosortase system